MQASLLRKLETLVERRTELDGMLAVPEVINDQDRYRTLSREHAEISPVVECFDRFRRTQDAIAHAEELMREDDAEMRAMAQEEAQEARESLVTLEVELQKLLIPKDPDDNADVFLEIRAGTGGDEAGLFAGDLLRMYLRYAKNRGWRKEV